MGKIITCYSYKEGAGCTTAVINIAHLLAQEGYKVLVVDIDLETSNMPILLENDNKKGFMNLIYDFKDFMREWHEDDVFETTFNNFENCNGYIQSLSENLSYLPSGKPYENHAKRISAFDWSNFYEIWHGYGFLQAVAERWRKCYDYILIDSQAGLSDIAGICTLQFPDTVLLFFELNENSLKGIRKIADSVMQKSVGFNHTGIPRIEFVGSKVYAESFQRHSWEVKACEKLYPYISAENHLEYIQDHRIPYVGIHSFGEIILAKKYPNDPIVSVYRKIMNDFIIQDKIISTKL